MHLTTVDVVKAVSKALSANKRQDLAGNLLLDFFFSSASVFERGSSPTITSECVRDPVHSPSELLSIVAQEEENLRLAATLIADGKLVACRRGETDLLLLLPSSQAAASDGDVCTVHLLSSKKGRYWASERIMAIAFE